MSNFDFLTEYFKELANCGMLAESKATTYPNECAIQAKQGLELCVKYMYSVDSSLVVPYNEESLGSLISTEEFRDIVDKSMYNKIDYIRKVGTIASTTKKKISIDQAKLAVKNLFIFADFVCYLYHENHTTKYFDSSVFDSNNNLDIKFTNITLQALYDRNEALKPVYSKIREERLKTYCPKQKDISEYETRKLYIDTMLQDAGWTEGKDWQNEVELLGMPNSQGVGYADYVLYDDGLKPMAVVEAKKTSVDISAGRQQASLYADIIEKKYGERPIVFLTNGFETRIIDNYSQEREISNIYSKRDIERVLNLYRNRVELKSTNIIVNQQIAGRYYQIGAVKAVCETLQKGNRKALLVMATGSGKTRTVISLCDVLLNHGWIKNILFLADRNILVSQAKGAFVNLLPNQSVTNLCEEKDNYSAHCVFSTYQTMINCIDNVKDDNNSKLFSSGHFDLIIVDEAHRSIYNKYRDIFTYFDAPLVGLTATPKDEIDKNTYDIFNLEHGVPTYGYELAQAVEDGYLVPYKTAKTNLKFLSEGIVYDDLTDEEKAEYEATFEQEDGSLPVKIGSTALNKWVFNEDTIVQALDILMNNGLKVNYGEKIGKTIIFAKNHKHAEKILEIFNREYPSLIGYAKVIDNYINYAESAIAEFEDNNKLPQIAISVDMLDTGVDIPEVLNLVFFKNVMSKAKFWQMIGRGTRCCPGLVDGKDKECFLIFDFCGNFDFFQTEKNGRDSVLQLPLQAGLFYTKIQIISKLQDIAYQTPELIEFRKNLVNELIKKVNELNRDNFAVKQHLKYVDMYSDIKNYSNIQYEDTLIIREELAPLILPDEDEINAVRFDALMYGIELAYLIGKTHSKAKSDLLKKVTCLSEISNIPAIMIQGELINKIIHTDYVEKSGINEFEEIRNNLRDLIKYIEPHKIVYITNFNDNILSLDWEDADLKNDDLKNYKDKVEYYIRQHQNTTAIYKLKHNLKLDKTDWEELEQLLWHDLGNKQDYEEAFGDKKLGYFIREIVGLDMQSAKEAFASFINDNKLDSNQTYFVNELIGYIAHNGVITDNSIFQESPFNDHGSVVDIFSNTNLWLGIQAVINQINSNANAINM